MRLPILFSTGLLLTLSFNTPVLSVPNPPVAQSPAIAKSQLKQLNANRQLWKKQNISNYRYTLSRSCFCAPKSTGPLKITVRNGRKISITDATNKPVEQPELFQKYDTIPKLFNLIEDAIAKKASNLTVQYDAKLGYPTQINIDYNSQIADDELYLTIENLQKIR